MIEDFGDLKDAVADWLKRTDLTSRIPQFIQLAESDINRRLLTDYDLATLSDSASNDLLDDHPDVYLYGTLAIATAWDENTEAMATRYGPLYERALNDAFYREFVESGEADKVLGSDLNDVLIGGTYDITRGD